MSNSSPAVAAQDAPVFERFDQERMMLDPYADFAQMRDLAPVVHVPAIGRYLLTTHAAVTSAENNPEIFTAHASRPTMVRAFGARPMLRKDDPQHAVERGAINPTLRPKPVHETWSPHFRENVEHWLDRLEEIGPDNADLNRDFAVPVASKNLLDLLGLPKAVDVRDVARWSTDFIAGIGNVLDDSEIWARCDRSQAEAHAVLDELLPHLTREPDASITSHLLQVGLDEQTVRANVFLTISGGMNEPQHMITNLVWALSGHPDQLDLIRNGQVSWGDAFEEAVRWLSPIGMLPRETTRDVDWAGHHIPAGADIGLLLASANRDEAVFADANSFNIERNARGHVGFGNGVHMCAGRWAAKTAVGEVALPMLYARFPNLRVDERRMTTWEGWVFRGVTSLPVTW
ncbi:cytochrome P450 [Nocardioides sp. NBC_00368]|uniref:cytochrome P450 n=1 Tax=Nocardioides sp. NBC_00368 TaxID=2976000 RepID=UPI002E1D7392